MDAGFDEHDIPYDVLWLDIEHTDGKRYMTWDTKVFPTPERMINDVSSRGRKMVTIVDPHVKKARGVTDDGIFWWLHLVLFNPRFLSKTRNTCTRNGPQPGTPYEKDDHYPIYKVGADMRARPQLESATRFDCESFIVKRIQQCFQLEPLLLSELAPPLRRGGVDDGRRDEPASPSVSEGDWYRRSRNARVCSRGAGLGVVAGGLAHICYSGGAGGSGPADFPAGPHCVAYAGKQGERQGVQGLGQSEMKVHIAHCQLQKREKSIII